MFGFSEAEAVGQSLRIIIPESLRQRHWGGFVQTMCTGRTRYGAGDVLAVPALRKDGARISIEFTILPFADEAGRIPGMAAIFRCVIHAMSVHGFMACRSSISRRAGRGFHGMSVHRFRACRSSS
jgi:hypothetical protein